VIGWRGHRAISQGLIDAASPPDALMMIELTAAVRLPAHAVSGGARGQRRRHAAGRHRAPAGITQVSTVISGLPMVTMPLAFQRAIIGQSLSCSVPTAVSCVILFADFADPGAQAGRRGQTGEVRGAQRSARDVWRFARGGPISPPRQRSRVRARAPSPRGRPALDRTALQSASDRPRAGA
jgi:hypothetical protein